MCTQCCQQCLHGIIILAAIRKKHQQLKPRGFVQLPQVAASPQSHSVNFSATPLYPLSTYSNPSPSTSSSSPRKKRCVCVCMCAR